MLAQMSIMPALCSYAFGTYYAQNYASIIREDPNYVTLCNFVIQFI